MHWLGASEAMEMKRSRRERMSGEDMMAVRGGRLREFLWRV